MARDQRRLAAIVSADVVGYSLLMGSDESATLADLKAHRSELIDPKIAEYRGRIVKTTGDGLLSEFPSVVDAVRCAVDVQRGMAERNARIPAERRIEFRIGINIGDIIIDDDDIFGDGVNVAARLQTLSEPGGICVSKVVHDQVQDKLNFTFEDLGEHEVKNIARPLDVYRVVLGGEVSRPDSPGRKQAFQWARGKTWRQLAAGLLVLALVGTSVWTLSRFWKEARAPGPPALSVAVVPLAAPAADADASRFADSLTRYLLTGLPSKREYGRVLVVSAGSNAGGGAIDAGDLGRRLNVRYVLEGDVLRNGDSNAVNLRLVDAATRAQVWSGRETLRDADIAQKSSATLRGFAGDVREAIVGAEESRVKAKPVSSLNAPELVLRAFAMGGEDTSLAGVAGAGKLVDEALRLEPDLVPALVLRAALFHDEGLTDPNADHERIAREQDRYTARAVQLDPTDWTAWVWRTEALESLRRWNAALEASATVINLDPFGERGYLLRADLMILMARPEEALALVDRARELSPNSPWVAATACEAYLFAGQTERAIATCEKATGQENFWWIHLVLAAAYAYHGDMAKAAAAKAEVLRINPGLTIAQLRAKHGSDIPEYVKLAEQYWYPGLRKAGLPEK